MATIFEQGSDGADDSDATSLNQALLLIFYKRADVQLEELTDITDEALQKAIAAWKHIAVDAIAMITIPESQDSLVACRALYLINTEMIQELLRFCQRTQVEAAFDCAAGSALQTLQEFSTFVLSLRQSQS